MSTRAAEIMLWCLLAALAILVRASVAGGPVLANDSYQYLSAAENFRRGQPAATSIVHFDTERSHGRIPAPLTTFPAGYPALIALVAAAGLPLERSAMLISFAAILVLPPMYARAAALLGASPAATRVTMALLVASSSWTSRGAMVSTEALFTALSFAALLALIRAESGAPSMRRYAAGLLAASALVAGAFWVRYAGLFLFTAAVLFHAARALGGGTRRALVALAALSLSALLIGAGLWRNHAEVGSWKGGNTKEVDNELLLLPAALARAMQELFLGKAGFDAMQALVVAAAAVVIGAALRPLWRARAALCADPRLQLMAVYLGVYTAAMLYLGADSMISFRARMFVPLLPVLLLLASVLCSRVDLEMGAAQRGALALLLAGYVFFNLGDLLARAQAMPHEAVQARLAAPAASGEPLRQWIEREVAPEAIVLATDGQATAYVLRRKAVSLVSPQFSEQAWTEPAVCATMARFGAWHLLVYRDYPVPSPFLAALASGSTPDWLRLLADNGHARVFGRAGEAACPHAERLARLYLPDMQCNSLRATRARRWMAPFEGSSAISRFSAARYTRAMPRTC
jgi:hypothetical protein